jgi:adenosylcobinamide-phosphate synthase
LSNEFHLSAPLILAALAIDAVAGDPRWLPHPVRLIGRAVSAGESALWSGIAQRDFRNGAILTVAVVVGAAITAWGLIATASLLVGVAGLLTALVLAWTTLAIRGLDRAAAGVERALIAGDLPLARREIRALVGRDPDSLDHAGLIRASVESIAENCSDGVIAPMLYLFVGGPVAAIAYKAVNTLDSMIGYLDERYCWFGRVAARLDDLVNLLPARATAFCLMIAAGLVSRRSNQAWLICITDASKHQSPNAGYPEATMAGALGIQLGGDAFYAGEVEHRATLGRAERDPADSDISAARLLMWVATVLAFCVLALARYVLERLIT